MGASSLLAPRAWTPGRHRHGGHGAEGRQEPCNACLPPPPARPWQPHGRSRHAPALPGRADAHGKGQPLPADRPQGQAMRTALSLPAPSSHRSLETTGNGHHVQLRPDVAGGRGRGGGRGKGLVGRDRGGGRTLTSLVGQGRQAAPGAGHVPGRGSAGGEMREPGPWGRTHGLRQSLRTRP